ncbi:MAG: hypothetical protein KDK99_19170, partial [Verrucomicrobiales bacterium]|nr:hypothetical protein [Verrucomicrobiales bacterium]
MKTFFALSLSALILMSAALLGAAQPATLADVPDPDPQVQEAGFLVPDGFEVNLFAADPMLRKPVQMNWDSQGRLWVVSSTTYPQI